MLGFSDASEIELIRATDAAIDWSFEMRGIMNNGGCLGEWARSSKDRDFWSPFEKDLPKLAVAWDQFC